MIYGKKKRFLRWRLPLSSILKISFFGHVTAISSSISDAVYQISSKSDDLSLRYGDLTIFKMAAVRHVKFKKIQFLSSSPCRHAVLLPRTKFRLNGTISR